MNSINPLGAIGHVQTYQKLLLSHSLTAGDRVVDATLGNGNDALMLLKLIGSKGFLYGFDIQETAIENSRNLLSHHGFDNCHLIQDSHSNLAEYVLEPIKGCLFNLGYLPKGDKQVTTLWQSTEKALLQTMKLLLPGGFIGVTAYPGHDSGREEDLAIQRFFENINQKEYQIAQTQFINQENHPPKLYWLTRRILK